MDTLRRTKIVATMGPATDSPEVVAGMVKAGLDVARINFSHGTRESQRKRVEMRFAHLKTHHGFERMRLRGLSGAHDEFLLAAIVQNLKTLALRIVGPPPDRQRPAFAQ